MRHRKDRSDVRQDNDRIYRRSIWLAAENKVHSILQRLLGSQPRTTSHHYRVADGRLFEELHVAGVMPRQTSCFADGEITIYCDDADDHFRGAELTKPSGSRAQWPTDALGAYQPKSRSST